MGHSRCLWALQALRSRVSPCTDRAQSRCLQKTLPSCLPTMVGWTFIPFVVAQEEPGRQQYPPLCLLMMVLLEHGLAGIVVRIAGYVPVLQDMGGP